MSTERMTENIKENEIISIKYQGKMKISNKNLKIINVRFLSHKNKIIFCHILYFYPFVSLEVSVSVRFARSLFWGFFP